MKDKIKKTQETAKVVTTNVEDIFNATAITATTVFAIVKALENLQKGYEWYLLLGAGIWTVYFALKAWSKVVTKR